MKAMVKYLFFFVVLCIAGCAKQVQFADPGLEAAVREYKAAIKTVRDVVAEEDLRLKKEFGAELLVTIGFNADWSPDGSLLAFGDPIRRGIKILDTQTGKIRGLTELGKDPSWSPDGRFIAYAVHDEIYEEVWLVEAEGGTPRKVAEGGFPCWSADGKSVIYHSRMDSKMFSVNIHTPNAEPNIYLDNCPGWYPAVSPDEELIAFGTASQLAIVDRETGGTVATWAVPGERGLLLSWSPDGRRIALGGYNDSILGLWVCDLAEGKVTQIARGKYTMPSWSKDGSKLAFDFREFPTRIWVIETVKIQNLLR